MRRLYWFQNNLRLSDNPGLLAQADAEQLLLVYLWPKNRPWCNVTGMGAQLTRLAGWAFISFATYYIHLVLIFCLFAYLPFSKLAHLVYRTVAMTYNEYAGRNF